MRTREMGLGLGILLCTRVLSAAGDPACMECHAVIQAELSRGGSHLAGVPGCIGCHVDHQQQTAPKEVPHYLRAAPVALCGGCHEDIGHKEFVHQPVKMDCTLCHNPHATSRRYLRAEINALCLECHSTRAKVVFETDGPAKLFGGKVTLPPRSFQNLKLLELSRDRGHPVSNHPVLRDADKEWPAVNCLSCHLQHGADKSAALLVTESENPLLLCQRCHK